MVTLLYMPFLFLTTIKVYDFYKMISMEQHALRNVNNCLNTNIYSYLESPDGQSSNLYLNVVNFFNTWVQCFKTFYVRNLRFFLISWSVCPWQAFLAKSSVCKQGWSLASGAPFRCSIIGLASGLTHKH